jgi:uncharacterized protein (TIGR02466 family)
MVPPPPPASGLRLHALFPTLVGEADHPDAEALNANLVDYVRWRERQEPDRSPLTTVNHGWQSGLDLLDADVPAIHALKRFINHHVELFLAEWGRLMHSASAPSSFRYDYRGWAVILRQGGFQHEHLHSRTNLVGVYYAQVPAVPPGVVAGGALSLTDPRGGRLATRAMWDVDRIALQPVAGRLLLFPSFLAHRVEQVLAPGERISINFDVQVDAVNPG